MPVMMPTAMDLASCTGYNMKQLVVFFLNKRFATDIRAIQRRACAMLARSLANLAMMAIKYSILACVLFQFSFYFGL
jgi:hypothetical protein